jgi:uncharacterized protein YecE (DUF72 family)
MAAADSNMPGDPRSVDAGEVDRSSRRALRPRLTGSSRTAIAGEPRIGCSGWNYKSWRGRFYPKGLSTAAWLAYYAAHFDTVEVNNTFYRLPERTTFVAWRAHLPPRFTVAVKASRFLTHMKRLRDAEEPIDRLLTRASGLGTRLGPVLYQLPATLGRDDERLREFLTIITRTAPRRRVRHVLEFRNPSWYSGDVYELLEQYGVSLCLHDMPGSAIAEPFVGPIVYVRFHGADGRYHGSYPSSVLGEWAGRLAERASRGAPVFAYFNNDPDAVAVRDAERLRALTNAALSQLKLFRAL